VIQLDEVPPVPPFEVQETVVKRNSTGGDSASAAVEVAVIEMVDVPVSSGNEPNTMGLGVGAVESPPPLSTVNAFAFER